MRYHSRFFCELIISKLSTGSRKRLGTFFKKRWFIKVGLSCWFPLDAYVFSCPTCSKILERYLYLGPKMTQKRPKRLKCQTQMEVKTQKRQVLMTKKVLFMSCRIVFRHKQYPETKNVLIYTDPFDFCAKNNCPSTPDWNRVILLICKILWTIHNIFYKQEFCKGHLPILLTELLTIWTQKVSNIYSCL